MKEDYLWDKSGEDAGIQALENALKAFRYEETAPPELPQKVFTVEKPRFFFRFRFAFAGFAAAIALIVLSVVWLRPINNRIPVMEAVADSAPKTEKMTRDEEIIKTPEPAPVVQVSDAPRGVKRKVFRAFERNAPKPTRVKTVLRDTNPKQPSETLTAEERYAYNQLMLALSITGSKLKLVKDKVNGIEDQNAVVETAK